MNSQEQLNLLKQMLTFFGGIGVSAGYLTVGQAGTLTNDIIVAIPALVSLASIAWSVYAHWNMKKVPEHAQVS